MQQRQSHSTVDNLEPAIGDVVRVTGKEWYGHPLMMSLGLVIDKDVKSGKTTESGCLVLFSSVRLWIYVSDLDVESRASPASSGTM
jgi:hypothetical protein